MAFRPDKALIRGELDNTVRGRVTGTLWFAGGEEPIVPGLLALLALRDGITEPRRELQGEE